MATAKSKWVSPPRMVNVISRGNEVFLAPTRASVAASDRYSSFLHKAATDIGQLDCKLTALVCALVIFETPGAAEDLGHMLKAALKIDATTSPAVICWYRNRRLYCRELSRHTCHLLNQVDRSTALTVETALSKADAHLAGWYPLPSQADPDGILDWVVNDASAWNFNHLPKPLMADLIGKQPIEPLPPAVMLRQFSVASNSAMNQYPEKWKTSTSEGALTEAIAVALLADDNRFSSAWMIDELLSALSTRGSGSAAPRKSHSRERDAAVRSISTLSKKLERCDSAAAMIFDWALFMLAQGTARTNSGNVQTIRIYLRDLAHDLYQEIRGKKFNPLDFGDDEWRKLLTSLLESPANASRGSAVAAFSKYLQLQIGVEPALPRNISKEVRPVSANVIWPHEFALALTRIQSEETDERLQQQLRVMLLIGIVAPIRIGELALLQLRSVRCKKSGEISSVEIEIAPSRTLHPGKSNAARRIMFVGTSEACQELMDWKARREEECAEQDDFLFGNPHAPLKFYQIGRSIQMLHRALKLATGDSSVSFHTLRHTVITRLVGEAFQLNDPNQATVRLKEVAVMAGHSHPATTLKHYFHLPFLALRACVDRHLVTFMSVKSTRIAWGKVNKLPPRHISQAFAASTSFSAQHKAGVSLKERAKLSFDNLASTQTLLSIEMVRKILLDISSGLSPESIAKRCSATQGDLMQIVDASLQVTSTLLPSRRREPLRISLDNIPSRFERLRERIGQVGLVFEEPQLSLHRAVWRHVENVSSEMRTTATRSWLTCFNNGFLKLQSRDDYEPFLRFLDDAKIPQTHLLIRAARAEATFCASASGAVDKTIQGIRALLGPNIANEIITARRGRPHCYLLIARRPVLSGFPTPPAACRMSEIHAAFAASAVLTLLSNQRTALA